MTRILAIYVRTLHKATRTRILSPDRYMNHGYSLPVASSPIPHFSWQTDQIMSSTSIESWCQSQVAPSSAAHANGDGCHPLEASALGSYLKGELAAPEAATQITAPVLSETDPPAELYRLWALLCQGLGELETEEQRRNVLDLVAAIHALSGKSPIDWSELTGVGNMWSDLYGLHLHGPDDWEERYGAMSDEREVGLRDHFKATGIAEAELYSRGLAGVTAVWAYEALSLVRSKRLGLDVFIHQIHAWLKLAGAKLKETNEKDPRCCMWFAVPVDGASRSEKLQSTSRTVEEHWTAWRQAPLDLAADGSPSSQEGRELAAKCYESMG
jgi:hypothetical protein